MAKKSTTRKKKTTVNKPYYQTKGLSIDGLLKKFGYLPESPKFYTLGPDFIDNYNELKSLVAKKASTTTIRKKDNFLGELLSKVLRGLYQSITDEEKTDALKEWLGITEPIEEVKERPDDGQPEVKKVHELSNNWMPAKGDRELYEKNEATVNEEPLTPPYYQVDGLDIDEELKKCDHLPETPKFYALGMDFVNKYKELKILVERGDNEAYIKEKDQDLISHLKRVFDMDKPTIDNLGDIPEILTNISKEHKMLPSSTALMVKNCTSHVEFYAIGNNFIPVMVNGKPKKYSINELQGSSKVITNENFLQAFSNLRTTSKNAVFFIYLEDKGQGDSELKVRLYIDGEQDIKFWEKLFEIWITGK